MKFHQYRAWQPFVIIVGIFLLVIAGPLFSNEVERVGLENGISAKVIRFGESSFWQPMHGVEMENLEQATYMPLAHWIEHTAMTFFDDGLLFDKIYSLFFFALIGCVLCACWHVMGHRPRTLWLPLMFALLSPMVMRMATGNYTELPLTFFLLTSIYFYLSALAATPRNLDDATRAYNLLPGNYGAMRILYCALAGFFAMLAFLVKGIIGLLPVLLPLVLWLTDDNRKRQNGVWPDMSVMLVMLLLCSVVLGFLDHGSFSNILTYWKYCFVGFPNETPIAVSRIYLFKAAGLQLLLPLVVFVLLCLPLIASRRLGLHVCFWQHKKDFSTMEAVADKSGSTSATNNKKMTSEELRNDILCVVFFVMGLLGLVVLSCGRCLRNYYVVSVIPFFAMSMACFVENSVQNIPVIMSPRWRMLLSLIACGFALAGLLTNVSAAANMRRQPGVRTDLVTMLPYLEENETVCATEGVHCASIPALFFKRYKNIQVDNQRLHTHLLSRYDEIAVSDFRGFYDEESLNTEIYRLYRRNEKEPTGKYAAVKNDTVVSMEVPPIDTLSQSTMMEQKDTFVAAPALKQVAEPVEKRELKPQPAPTVKPLPKPVSTEKPHSQPKPAMKPRPAQDTTMEAVYQKKTNPAPKKKPKVKEPSYMPTYR